MQSNASTNTTLFPFTGVILDMDGTLIESTEADYLAWKMLFAEFGFDFSFQEYMPMLGTKSVDVIGSRLQLSGDALQQALAKKMAYFREIVTDNGIQEVPFALAFIKSLKKYPVKIALATSSRREKMKLVMEKTGMIAYFDVIVTGEEVHHGKPAPDIFLLAAERLGMRPEQCVVLEDTASGVSAAKNAQMKCIAITTTHTPELLHKADLVVDSYEDVDFGEWCKRLMA